MRLKGINPFEQHAEKFVAGLFALGLLGVVAWQFLGPASKVKVGSEEVNPPEAYDKIAANARRTEDSIKRGQELPKSADEITRGFDKFGEKLTAPIARNPELAVIDKATPIGAGSAAIQMANAPMSEVKVPAPGHAMAATNMSTVAPSEQQMADVAKVLPAAAPFDKASVTVEATFDGAELKKALGLDPDDAGPIRAIPGAWYSSGVQIIGVELHRQMLKPDGTWSDAVKVKQMPGRPLFVDEADTLNDAAKLKTASTFAAEQSEMIRRTPYYSSILGETWASPSERAGHVDVEADNKATQVANLKRDYAGALRALKNLQDSLAKVGQPIGSSPGGGGGGGGGSGKGAGGGGGGGGGRGNSPPPSSGPSSGDEARKKTLQNQITKAQDKIEQIKTKLRDLGSPVEGDTTPVATPDPSMKPKSEPAVLESPDIKLWAHDVFVERGRTYRYQVVVLLTNPYFGHSPAMVAEQADKLAKTGIMRSPASDWTDPITVDPETYLFFTAATDDDPAAGRSASALAEVFQFRWGYWRRGSASLQPGDAVAAEIKVPDFSKILAAAPDPNNPNNPGTPSPTPGSGTGTGGKMGGSLGGSPSPSPRQDAPAAPAAPPPMVTVQVEKTNQIMIGVGQGAIRDSAGKSKQAQQVYVREGDGEVRVFIPDAEKGDPAYTRISRSAERGQKELTPNTDRTKTLPTIPQPGSPVGTPPPPPGGRGG